MQIGKAQMLQIPARLAVQPNRLLALLHPLDRETFSVMRPHQLSDTAASPKEEHKTCGTTVTTVQAPIDDSESIFSLSILQNIFALHKRIHYMFYLSVCVQSKLLPILDIRLGLQHAVPP